MTTDTPDISVNQCNQWEIENLPRISRMNTDTPNISANQCYQWEIDTSEGKQMNQSAINLNLNL